MGISDKVKTDSKGYATLNINTNVKPNAYIITAEYKGVKVSNRLQSKTSSRPKTKRSKNPKRLLK